MRESLTTKPLYIYIYIYIYTDAPDIIVLTNVCIFLLLLNQIPAPQMNPADFHLSLFKLFSSDYVFFFLNRWKEVETL